MGREVACVCFFLSYHDGQQAGGGQGAHGGAGAGGRHCWGWRGLFGFSPPSRVWRGREKEGEFFFLSRLTRPR